MIAAATKLARDALCWPIRAETTTFRKVTTATDALQSVKQLLNNLKQVKIYVVSEKCAAKSKTVKGYQQGMQEGEMSNITTLGIELENLANSMGKLMITDLEEIVENTLCNLVKTSELVPPPEPPIQEDGEPDNIADNFGVTSESLGEVVRTLKDKLEDLKDRLEEDVLSRIVLPMSWQQLESLGPLIMSVKCIAEEVDTRQTQVNSLSLVVSSLAAAATELMENAKGITVEVAENTAKSALDIATMNINATELTIATSTLAREAIDLSTLRNKLLKIENNLTAASDSIDPSRPRSSEIINEEKLNCVRNLTAAAKTLTKVVVRSTSHEINPPTLTMAKQLTTAAANIATAASYILYSNPPSVLEKLQKTRDAAKELTKTVSNLISVHVETKEPIFWCWWWFCAYSMLFPLCCLLNHLNYIIIAFIHDLYHATGVAIAYGVIAIFLYVMLDNIPYVLPWKNLLATQGIKFLAVCALILYVAMDIVLYFYIPIESAFDDAANHFISIYNTTAVFFTAIVLYFVIGRPSRSPIKVFTRALDQIFYNDEKATQLSIRKEDWKQLDDKDKDIEVAKGLLKKIE